MFLPHRVSFSAFTANAGDCNVQLGTSYNCQWLSSSINGQWTAYSNGSSPSGASSIDVNLWITGERAQYWLNVKLPFNGGNRMAGEITITHRATNYAPLGGTLNPDDILISPKQIHVKAMIANASPTAAPSPSSAMPTANPSLKPISALSTAPPSDYLTRLPSVMLTTHPSLKPISVPSAAPSKNPTSTVLYENPSDPPGHFWATNSTERTMAFIGIACGTMVVAYMALRLTGHTLWKKNTPITRRELLSEDGDLESATLDNLNEARSDTSLTELSVENSLRGFSEDDNNIPFFRGEFLQDYNLGSVALNNSNETRSDASRTELSSEGSLGGVSEESDNSIFSADEDLRAIVLSIPLTDENRQLTL